MKQAINMRFDKNILSTLDNYAKELNQTRTSLIQIAVKNYFDKLDEQISDQRIDNLKNNKSKLYSIEEVFEKANLCSK